MNEPFHTSLLTLGAVVALFGACWLLSLRLRDAGIVDIIWGPGFALIGWIGWLQLRPGHPSALLVLACVTIWSLRLGWHLWARHRLSRREDARYAAMRAVDPERFATRSLWTVFMLQAGILWGLALPIHLAMGGDASGRPGLLSLVGLVLFVAGFAVESVADAALLAFRRDPANRGRLLTSGLFAWSRHPNYFGECVLWTGIGLMAWDASGSALAMLGPAALTALILRVSGVPLLDEHMRRTRPDYAEYAARTSAIIPRPPRS